MHRQTQSGTASHGLGARTPEPRQPGVWLDRHRVERQRRAGCIQGLVDRVAKGEDVLLLCRPS